MWSKSNSSRSPAALDTKKVEPIPSPPSHLLNDLSIQLTLSELQGYVNTNTPFDIDKLELFLRSHPNQLFVRSIMRSLREGFWPFDKGEWDEFSKDMANYSMDELDLSAIRDFKNKECGAQRWSSPLPFQHLLSGMKTSPMSMVWQKQKPRIITDHVGSDPNNGISRENSKVKYNDMHPFGQAMHQAVEQAGC